MRSKLHSASLQSSKQKADAEPSTEVTIDEADVAHIEKLGFSKVQAREALGCLRVAKFARNQQRRCVCVFAVSNRHIMSSCTTRTVPQRSGVTAMWGSCCSCGRPA